MNYSVAPYDLETPQLLFSVTKSITSLAIGIASDLNLLSLEDTVVSFFPDQLPKQVGKHLSMMTIRDLLTMTAGIQEDTYPQLVIKKDWVKAFLAQDFPQKPGCYYQYSTHASHMLSAVISRVSGQLLSEFLMEQLFSKMGISYPQWEQSPEGYTCGGMGLSLATNDLLKIGQLLANSGNYQGQQLISTNYLEQATTGQIVKQNVSRTDILGYQYGFQFHILQDGTYRADGAFGQLYLVHPETNMVIVATSNGTKMATLIELIYDYLIKPRQKEQQVSTLTITNNQKFDFKGKKNDYF